MLCASKKTQLKCNWHETGISIFKRWIKPLILANLQTALLAKIVSLNASNGTLLAGTLKNTHRDNKVFLKKHALKFLNHIFFKCRLFIKYVVTCSIS